jgi:6-phosphofructokinase 1
MRIGVLTGGGDVPGLNPCIRTLVYRGVDEGHQLIGIRRGWEGLLHFNPSDPASEKEYTQKLNKINTRNIERVGGTMLRTSRTNPGAVAIKRIPEFLQKTVLEELQTTKLDFTHHVLNVLDYLKLDVLIPIGGDDTLGYGARLFEEGVPLVSIPKTMDNDVFGTDYCIGFSTAITRSIKFINQLRTTSESHERLAIIELFGRNSGETCLITAYLSAIDRAIISEVPFDPDKLTHFLLEDRSKNPDRYAIAAISEGARFTKGEIFETGEADSFGHRKLGGIGLLTAEKVKQISGQSILYQQLAYLMRSGTPDSLDIMVASNFANLAMDLINAGVYGRMVSLQGGRYTHVAANTVTQGVKNVDVDEFYDVDNYRPKVHALENKPMFLY